MGVCTCVLRVCLRTLKTPNSSPLISSATKLLSRRFEIGKILKHFQSVIFFQFVSLKIKIFNKKRNICKISMADKYVYTI